MTVSISDMVACTDIHNTNLADQNFRFESSGPRFYSRALTNLQSCVDYAEEKEVDAIIQLGDQIDAKNSEEEKTRMTLLDEVQAILHSTSIPAYNVMGNWELGNPSDDPLEFDNSTEYFAHMKNGPASYCTDAVEYTDSAGNEVRRYYTFDFGDALGIVLDSSGSNPNYTEQEYYKGDATLTVQQGAFANYVRATQLAWLTTVLTANTTKPIVIFCHHWTYASDRNEYGFQFTISNEDEVLAILEAHQASHGNIAGVFGAHHHPGAKAWWTDKWTTPPSIEGAVYYEAFSPFMVLHNGIKHFRLAAAVRGWGSDSGGVDETASNIYYLIEVGRFVTNGNIDIRVTGIGNNPDGDSQSAERYAVL